MIVTEDSSPPAKAAHRIGQEPLVIPVAGGKGAQLSALIGGGFPVPASAVVTTAAYDRFVAAPAIAELVSRLADGADPDDDEIDACFLSVKIPEADAAEIQTIATDVGSGSKLAVRSSSPAEDLAGSSFAGQYRSLLDIGYGDDLLDACRLVWASLWHRAPRAYRRFRGVASEQVSMAVVLMRMVPALQAGVVFTTDPAGGEDLMRIEVVDGLAEGLVSGAVTPRPHLVSRDARTAAPSLLLDDLRTMTLDIERHMGSPQDIEWAFDGALWIVQSRPITTTGVAAPDPFDDVLAPQTRYTTAGIAEMLPGVLSPMVWSLNAFLLEESFRHTFDVLGVLPDDLTDALGMVQRHEGRALLDLDRMGAVSAAIPGGSPEELEREFFGTTTEGNDLADQPVPQKKPSRLRSAGHDLRALRARRRARVDAEIGISAVAQTLDRRPGLEEAGDDELLAFRRRLIDLGARVMAAELGVAAAAVAAHSRLETHLIRYLDEAEGRSWALELTTLDDVGLIGRARGSAEALAAHPEAMAARSWTDAIQLLEERDATAAVAELTWLRNHVGSQSIFAGPTWAEQADQLLALVSGRAVRLSSQRNRRTLDELESTLKSQPGWRRTRILTGQVIDVRVHLVRRLLADAVSLLAARERTKLALLDIGGIVREIHVELGRRLTDRGTLDRPADIDLVVDRELQELLADGGPTPDLIVHRARELERQQGLAAPPIVFRGEPETVSTELPAGSQLTGWAASAGRATGRARVLRTPTVDAIDRGDIVVATSTDASWSPVFMRAGAVIVEQGGPLSHAAIVARELGLPAVTNVPGAVAALEHIERVVTVDGDEGVIVIHDASEELSR